VRPSKLEKQEPRNDDSLQDQAVCVCVMGTTTIARRLPLQALCRPVRPTLLLRPMRCWNSSATTTVSKPFCLNARIDINPERRDEFLEVIQSDQTGTMANEPGALQFVVGEDIDTPNAFYLYEEYTSEDAFNAHNDMPHFAPWKKFCETDPFPNPPIPNFYHGTHAPEKIPVRAAFCEHGEFCVKPERREDFIKVIQNFQEATLKEPLCLRFKWGECKDTPNTFYFHGEFTGDEDGSKGFEAHVASPHVKELVEFMATKPFTKPFDGSKYKTVK
jgi:quinol monooxygenase YgiN